MLQVGIFPQDDESERGHFENSFHLNPKPEKSFAIEPGEISTHGLPAFLPSIIELIIIN